MLSFKANRWTRFNSEIFRYKNTRKESIKVEITMASGLQEKWEKDEKPILGEKKKVNESSSFYSTGNRSIRFSKGY